MELGIFNHIGEVLDLYNTKKDSYKLIAEEIRDYFDKYIFPESEYELQMIYRIKSASSIREKLIRNNYDVISMDAEGVLASLRDVIGLRIECKFIEEEKYAYDLLKAMFDQTEDSIFYYMPQMPRIRLKLSEKQPQTQKNGFEIYKIDGFFMMGKETVNFELQIKSLVNSFWSEIEHRVVYKNRDFQLSDTFVSDLFKSIKENLNTLDSQLYLLYNRFHDDDENEKSINSQKKERSIEIFIANMVYETFDDLVIDQLGFPLDFKASCDAIVRYLMQRADIDELEDYGRIMMHFFNLLDEAQQKLQLTEEIKFDRKLRFQDGFTEKIGKTITSYINTNFRWHLYFSILFAMESQTNEISTENFVQYYRNLILKNRMIQSFKIDDKDLQKEIIDVLMNEVANKIYDSQKIEYLTVDGVVAVHKALNFIIPLIQYEISHGEQWDSIKDKYIDKYLFLLTI